MKNSQPLKFQVMLSNKIPKGSARIVLVISCSYSSSSSTASQWKVAVVTPGRTAISRMEISSAFLVTLLSATRTIPSGSKCSSPVEAPGGIS